MSTQELIDNVKNDDLVKARTSFDGLMASKINTAMDTKKVELGSTMTDRVKEKQAD